MYPLYIMSSEFDSATMLDLHVIFLQFWADWYLKPLRCLLTL